MSEAGAWGYELTFLFATAFRAAVDDLHRELAAQGFDDVRPSHGYAFQKLSFGGATGIELAEHLDITKQAATQMIDYLEGRGYVERRPHPSDGRGKLVVLTERGWACIRATEAQFVAMERRWRERLGEQEAERLTQSMRDIVRSFGEGTAKFRPVW
ncbi:MarR family winged helix-turn-helix transcriptional regulator [Cohnella rhizosphaerae]|uniref:MarR family transcriptional regulator n=1 Tax=Cohnella rhizosphaerae TaxID=1457232 RepID=A0A9X4KV01_9BACL|nr:MarR family transcriptional regulator [Cohnella rhizosphaerae]MDG0811575.1 MarR family transcriptional regulator [Cohnella rhizosphaerae]